MLSLLPEPGPITEGDAMSEDKTTHYAGGCHCGAVRFEVDLDLSKGVSRCNCTVCVKLGRAGAIVKPSAFKLTKGEEVLTDYQWGSRTSHLMFCKHCGTHTFLRGNIPQLGGEYVGVNVQCLDDIDLIGVPVHHFDGRHNNWQAGPRSGPWPVRP